jgi:hypothetical protein
MDFHRPRDTSSPWVLKSDDGYYAVAKGESPHVGTFEAFHIEAVWATPTSIGHGGTLEAATEVCFSHRRGNRAPV